jgi:hypothetical protein
MNQTLLNEFKSPPSEYRGKPFWAWNGRLEPEELRWQVRMMHSMGLGGFFMHSRVGLETAYLSDDWFDCVKACVDEADKLDMEAWLYDEDRWPSGAAGGLVTKNPKYRMRFLAMEKISDPRKVKWDADVLAVFTAKIDGITASGVKRIARGRRPQPGRGESVLVFHVKTAPLSDWYNKYTYLDVLSHEAVREFIRVTHEAYRKRIGKHFGKVVPGIFTDEPNHGSKFARIQDTSEGDSVPWTAKLPATFRKRYGYDILSHLPELFFDVDGQSVTPARHDYHDCVTFLFTDAFARQIGDWCEKNGLEHTGHVLHEATLSQQSGVVGSCMRFYEYMQAPGMDILTEYNREYDTAKQVSSAARQFDRKWRLTETYGCTGWDFPFAGHKAVGDWQAALGINLRCQHLSWYTMEGQAKRDYPASIFYQSPWWELYSTVEDYFARIHAVMTKGSEVRDLLVIYPVESMWMHCRQDWVQDPAVDRYDRIIFDLRDCLLAGNIDFDYGDEDILARHSKVAGKSSRAELVVGKARYKTVVVPPLITMRGTTLRLLKRFAAAGGTVIFAGKAAEYVDAVASDAAAKFAADCVKTPPKGDALVAAVAPSCRRISITDAAGEEIVQTLHLLREDKDNFYLFVCNTGHDFRKTPADIAVAKRTDAFDDVRIRGLAGAKGVPVELDPQTGESFSADAIRRGSRWEIRTSLPAIGSRLFVIPKKAARKSLPKRRKLKDVNVRKLNPPKWDIVLSECNNLVLDRPRYKIGGARPKVDEILRVDRAVREALGIAHRGGAMVQPWARAKSKNPKKVPLELMYTFDVRSIPSGDLMFGIEHPELYRIFVNGTEISIDAECGWWTDKSLRKIPLAPSLLQVGQNLITITCEYDENHPGLEIAYLLGNFGAEVRGTNVTVTKMPTSLKLGDWVKQGLAFYSGSVNYMRTVSPRVGKGRRLIVQVPGYRGTAVRVLVNGKSAGVIGWQPNEVDITDYIEGEDEKVQLTVEVISHRRNSHGPLHLSDKQPLSIGPEHFVTDGKAWTDNYQLVPCGLTEPPRLITRK